MSENVTIFEKARISAVFENVLYAVDCFLPEIFFERYVPVPPYLFAVYVGKYQ